MKKLLKKEVIIAFIIGVLIASGITVYATTYFASQVTYKDDKTVEQALNDLYSNMSNNLNYVSNIGIVSSNYRTAATKQFTLNKGKYILVAVARAVEYGSTYSISGSSSLKEVSGDISTLVTFMYSDKSTQVENLRSGRGTGGIKVYEINVNNAETLTFSIANNCPSNDNIYCSVGSVAIYKFE